MYSAAMLSIIAAVARRSAGVNKLSMGQNECLVTQIKFGGQSAIVLA